MTGSRHTARRANLKLILTTLSDPALLVVGRRSGESNSKWTAALFEITGLVRVGLCFWLLFMLPHWPAGIIRIAVNASRADTGAP